jgi:hypothetical protein
MTGEGRSHKYDEHGDEGNAVIRSQLREVVF